MTITSHGQELKPSKGKNDKYGYVDNSGKSIIRAKYDEAAYFSDGLAKVKLNGKYGFINYMGEEVIPLKYEYAGSFNNGVVEIQLNGKYGFIDKTDKIIMAPKYDRIWAFSDGRAKVILSGKYGFIDERYTEVIAPQYDDASAFSEGYVMVKQNDKCGFLNYTGKLIIPLKYDGAGSFSEGLAPVKINGKYGFIDTTGKEAIPFKYDEASSFYKGTAYVVVGNQKLFINKQGIDEEQAKKEEKEKEEKARKEQQLIISLTRTDTSAKKVFDIYLEQDKLLFAKVNALNEYLRSSMPNTRAPIFNYQWPSIALEMKNNYCKNAKSQLDSYRAKLKEIALTKGQNELYDKVTSHFETVSDFISSCHAWADFISNRPDDVKDVDKQLKYLETNQKAMKKSDEAIRIFIETYKKRNKI
jgi:hypothetical protein